MRIVASLLSSDLLNLEDEIKALESAGVDELHVDIMDGHFVPNIAFGFEFVERILKITDIPVSAHLMIKNPDKFIEKFSKFQIKSLFIHSEIDFDIVPVLECMSSKGISPGIAINPETAVSDIVRYVPFIERALVMGVNPGLGGQPLIPQTILKISKLREINNALDIGIDGGVNCETISEIMKEKPDFAIVGNYLFLHNGEDRSLKDRIKILKSFSTS